MVGIAAHIRANSAIIMGLAISLCVPQVTALAQEQAIEISATDLATSLYQLARAADVELLFDQSLVEGRSAEAVRNANSAEQALDQLLSGTGLSYRRTDNGAFVILADQAGSTVPIPEPLAIEEILIVGRRTQNVDIARSEDDIQPYKIANSADILSSQSSTVQEFLQTRLPSNAQHFTTMQDPAANMGSVRSQIDLRGLGTDQTLVLIDGRRLPAVPFAIAFGQSGRCRKRLDAIDRIETLAASASGIFGIGAAGGVVNVILKREFEGAEFSVSNGISQRGDGLQWSVGGRIGYSNSRTGTRVMVSVGRAEDDGLRAGDRDFIVKARALRSARSPDMRETVVSPSINFNSITGAPLTLKQGFGGGSLGATTTFMPVGSPAMTNGGAEILKANAGQYDIRLSPDFQGTLKSLLTAAHTTSVLATIRQKVTTWGETYVDLLHLRNDGHAVVAALDTSFGVRSPADTANPFNEPVVISFPIPDLQGRVATSTVTDRLSAGLIVRLGSKWNAAFDAAIGQSTVRWATDTADARPQSINAISGPDVLTADLASLSVMPYRRGKVRNHMYDVNLRLGGTLFDLPGGPLTLTATAEYRQELNNLLSDEILMRRVEESETSHSRREVGSAFFEVRAPLVPSDSTWRVLRSLEVQLALRADRYTQTAPSFIEFTPGPDVTNKDAILAGTYGLRVTPLPGMMLRGSISTGFTPPTPSEIVTLTFPSVPISGLIDPKRGGGELRERSSVSLLGSADLEPQETVTYSAGVVFSPRTVPGLRVAIDYSQLRTTGEITRFALGNLQYFVDHEDSLDGRITRAALTETDVALDYQAGAITAIDASYLQIGRSVVQTIDFDIDYVRDTPLGFFRFYMKAAWEPSFRRWGDPAKPSYNLVDHPDGPLSWRGNGGVDWQRGNWSSGVNIQYYNAYSGYYAGPPTRLQMAFLDFVDPAKIADTNATHIPSQVYVDWTLAYRFTLTVGEHEADVEYRFGIKNLLDAQPPVVAGTLSLQTGNTGLSTYDYNPFGGYSPYGDPRGRRFEFRISSSF